MLTVHPTRFAVFAIQVIALWLPFSVGMASPVAVGGSTSSTLVVSAVDLNGDLLLALNGTASGSGYALNARSAIFCGGSGTYYWCSGGVGSIYLSGVLNTDSGDYQGVVVGDTLSQGGDGGIGLTLVDLETNPVTPGLYTEVFAVSDDPVLLSSLVPASSGIGVAGVNYVDLTVTGGCYDNSENPTCTVSSPVPAPASLLLLGSGLTALVFIRRRPGIASFSGRGDRI